MTYLLLGIYICELENSNFSSTRVLSPRHLTHLAELVHVTLPWYSRVNSGSVAYISVPLRCYVMVK